MLRQHRSYFARINILKRDLRSLVISDSLTKSIMLQRFVPPEYTVTTFRKPAKQPAFRTLEEISFGRLHWDGQNTFLPFFETTKGSLELLEFLKKKCKDFDQILMAYTPGIQGEVQSWLLKDSLELQVPIKFLEIKELDQSSINEALDNPRDFNIAAIEKHLEELVVNKIDIDYLSKLFDTHLGRSYQIIPEGMKILNEICSFYNSRKNFKSSKFSALHIVLSTPGEATQFNATLTQVGNTQIVSSLKDFDPVTGANLHQEQKKMSVVDLELIVPKLKDPTVRFLAQSTQHEDYEFQPDAPFSILSLITFVNRVFGYSAGATLNCAQDLYERGLISCVNTTSVTLSNRACTAAKFTASQIFGDKYVAKNDSELLNSDCDDANKFSEAIRPTIVNNQFLHPSDVLDRFKSVSEQNIYSIIFYRTLASVMSPALIRSTNVKFVQIQAKKKFDSEPDHENETFTSLIKHVVKPGHLLAKQKLYQFDHFIPLSNENSCNEIESESLNFGASNVILKKRLEKDLLLSHEQMWDPVLSSEPYNLILDNNSIFPENGIFQFRTHNIVSHQTEYPKLSEANAIRLVQQRGINDVNQILAHIQSMCKSLIYVDKYHNFIPTLEALILENFSKIDPCSKILHRSNLHFEAFELAPSFASPEKGEKLKSVYKFWEENAPITTKKVNQSQLIDFFADDYALYSIDATSYEFFLIAYLHETKNTRRVKLAPFYCQDITRLTPELLRKLVESSESSTDTQNDSNLNAMSIAEMLLDGKPHEVTAHPVTGKPVVLRNGPYGPYLQTQDPSDRKKKIQRVLSEPFMNDFSLLSPDMALEIFSLPKVLCYHPDYQDMDITVGYNKKGKYILFADIYVSIPFDYDLNALSDEEAIQMINSALSTRNIIQIYSKRDNSYLKLYDGKFGYFLGWKDLKVGLPQKVKNQSATEIKNSFSEESLWNLIQQKQTTLTIN